MAHIRTQVNPPSPGGTAEAQGAGDVGRVTGRCCGADAAGDMDLLRELQRLNAMPLRGPGTLEQSQRVDRLLVERMRGGGGA